MASQNNIAISGDEARILMAALRTSTMALPVGTALEVYMRLAAISQVQPPNVPQAQETTDEG